MSVKRRAVVALLAIGTLWQRRAGAEERKYSLVIGYNGAAAVGEEDASASSPLRYADDDALAFYEFQREGGGRSILLASPDADTRRRYPDAADAARAPTLEELERGMATLREEMLEDLRAGRQTVFFFFYSGHGVRGREGKGALTLRDGEIDQHMLFDRVLSQAPAEVIHLLVDACHAEAVVRARDGDEHTVTLTPADIAASLSQTTLNQYPRVGLVIASSSDGTAHEWDLYQSGVFTHEVISGLRGAADVNGDGRIEYSEIEAFLSAANREVPDPRARLRAIVKAPVVAPRAALADLSSNRASGRLTGITAAADAFYIEDTRGNRLADGRTELGFSMSLALPADQRLFLRRGRDEAELVLKPGTDVSFTELTFRARPIRARGAVENALRAGLFLTGFGPAYYRGYVDRQEMAAVPLAPAPSLLQVTRGGVPLTTPEPRRSLRPTLLGAAGGMLVTSIVFTALASDARQQNQHAFERDSPDVANRFRVDTALAAGALSAGAACAAVALFTRADH
jgi:hypothetical protein